MLKIKIMRAHCNVPQHYLLILVFSTAILHCKQVAGLEKNYSETAEPIAVAAVAQQSLNNSLTPITFSPRIPAPQVKLNKCCHYGEYLDATKACVSGSSDQWVPLIFLIGRKTYYSPKGGHPNFMIFDENVRPVLPPTNSSAGCSMQELELYAGSGNLVVFSNGSLFLQEHALLVKPEHYCIDRDSALICFPKNQIEFPRLKVKKCCGKDGSYDVSTKTCTFDASKGNGKSLKLPIDDSVFQTTYGFPQCLDDTASYVIAGDWKTASLTIVSGDIRLQHKNLSLKDYCLEHLRDENDSPTTVKVFACAHHFVSGAPANAISPATAASDRLLATVLNIALVISVVFLAATLIAGYLLPSVHHALHWRCQIYYVFCLFFGDLLLAYSQLSDSVLLGSTACVLLANVMHFFFLSAFFWLNTMCFNIWWTFRDFRPSSLERNQEVLRLRLYSAYAWGIPLLISVIAACVDQLQDDELLRPGFGVRSCWFSGEHLSIFAYFFAPVGILLCLNIMLFISTTHQLTCGLWKRDDVKSSTEKTALGKVCLKLVVVMGVTWISEIISWVVGGPHSVWFLTDLINALQGVFIFVVVGCQPQVWSACKRFCCPRSRQEITNTTNGQHSSSSHGLPSMAACGVEVTQNTSVNTTIGTNHTQNKMPMETVC